MSAIERYNQLAEQVTNEIILGLEKGEVFWQQPWQNGAMPKNIQSGRYYDGFNALYLNYITLKKKYANAHFLTYKQAQQLGGNVKKGEKGHLIVFWKINVYKVGEKETNEGKSEDVLNRRFTPFIWSVFNVDQCEGLTLMQQAPAERTENEVIEACEEVVTNMPNRPHIHHEGNDAFYSVSNDLVQLPERKHFISSPHYYSVLFHELIHSTGHPSRLNRRAEEGTRTFGDAVYSKEELIAEIGANFLNAHTGIKDQVFDNSVSYIQGWLEALKNDKTMILTASSKAAAAARYILDLEEAAQEQEEEKTTEATLQKAA
ncbi:ArdC family protein [Adhaeribacter aquaticus]|uniref:ArdC family protein n=1 Tax=Adhaeribacter aquaticus TaxID=299567 RepID=UPI000402D973|nr:zincin-like metallopeptidase domain-containing protein [Adhaeribacter aquaticus]